MKGFEESSAPGVRDTEGLADAWNVLIADDDDAVHQVTKMVMSGFSFDGRSLKFLSAYSGQEACHLMAKHSDIALILLDVVMETDDAGFEVARYIRSDLGNHETRIVLRTGQPGQAPEEDVIRQYDINDYRDKTELTKTKLTTVFYSALRSYRDILAYTNNEPHNATGERSPSLINKALHEISTPLGVSVSGVSYLVELLEKLITRTGTEAVPPEMMVADLRSCLEAAQLSAENLNRSIALVQRFRVEQSGDGERRIEHFNLAEMVKKLLHSFQLEAAKCGAEFELQCPDPLDVSTDSGALTQILCNLITNSFKHGFAGIDYGQKKTIRLQVSLSGVQEAKHKGRDEQGAEEQERRWVELAYSDTGQGIPEDVRPKIFDAYFTTNAQGGGEGIGLSVARALARSELGGDLTLVDDPESDSGVVFRLYIPVKRP